MSRRELAAPRKAERSAGELSVGMPASAGGRAIGCHSRAVPSAGDNSLKHHHRGPALALALAGSPRDQPRLRQTTPRSTPLPQTRCFGRPEGAKHRQTPPSSLGQHLGAGQTLAAPPCSQNERFQGFGRHEPSGWWSVTAERCRRPQRTRFAHPGQVEPSVS